MPNVEPNPDTPQQRVRGEELRRRIELVRTKLLAGNTRRWVAKLVTSEWGLKPSQAWAYVRKAEEEIQEIASRNADTWLAEHVAIRRDIRRRANDANDFRSELAAAESEAKLLGIEPPTKIQHSGSGGGPIVTEVVIEHHDIAEPNNSTDPATTASPAAKPEAPRGT